METGGTTTPRRRLLPKASERKYATTQLTRKEIAEAARAGLEWAIELKQQVKEADAWIKKEEEWAIKWVSSVTNNPRENVCPICYRDVWLHNLDWLIACGEKWRERNACEHDWADDFMGGSICRKCKQTS